MSHAKCICKPIGSGKNRSCAVCHPRCICDPIGSGNKTSCPACYVQPYTVPVTHDKPIYGQIKAERGRGVRLGEVLDHFEPLEG